VNDGNLPLVKSNFPGKIVSRIPHAVITQQTRVYDHPGNGGTMTADPLGGTMH
jgi:hypothetical protein